MSEHCTVEWIEEDQYFYVKLHRPSQKAIDDYFAAMVENLDKPLAKGITLTLIDIRTSGFPSISYFVKKSTEFQRNHVTPPYSKTSILYSSNLALSLVEIGSRLLLRSNDAVKIFQDESESLAWLLAK